MPMPGSSWRGDYPNVSAAVSGELARARAAREREQALLEAEVRRRIALPLDRWEPVGSVDDLFLEARERTDALQRQGGSDEGRDGDRSDEGRHE
jgi:antitoxin ParD1/3/4